MMLRSIALFTHSLFCFLSQVYGDLVELDSGFKLLFWNKTPPTKLSFINKLPREL